MAFIRTLLKRFKENSFNFCGLRGKQDLTQGPRRTVSSTGASVDFFWTACSMQPKKRCSVTEAAMACKIECNRQATALEDKLREVEEAFHEI